ncbi:hypothetical protein [Metabacillus litoralis]|uniref:hypothetical protein n=1 Tax=Metabacillus litoralis TaxID=152268 RepID=UPI001CFE77B6|nr:hypothetical protein [Metabacillus litoralis]
MKILTVPSAKKEIRRLQNFINLVHSYEANSLEKWIIKEYAYTSSIRERVISGTKRRITSNGIELESEYVKNVFAAKPKDVLHSLVRTNYRAKIEPNYGINNILVFYDSDNEKIQNRLYEVLQKLDTPE